MDPAHVQLILQLLKIACPHLQKMAKASANPFDDFIVNLICAVATLDIPPEILKKGGK